MISETHHRNSQAPARGLTFYLKTFGCQMNENDSERVAGILTHLGGQRENSLEKSDLIIINTCAVRKKPEDKLSSLLGRLARLKKKRKIVVGVIGCVAQLYQSQILEKNPWVDFIIGPDNYQDISRVIPDTFGEKFVSTNWKRDWDEIPHEITVRESEVSAYVTIMEGCNNFCSYCIVPYTRGREKHRPFRHIIREVEDLASRGYREIQLLGQNVDNYRDPSSGMSFASLLREVDGVKGLEWVRFITSHPKNFTPEIASAMKEGEKICHQLHLPLQSGSTSVLKRMNRGYTQQEYWEIIGLLQKLMPDINLSTDIIVGFPGETEKEFTDTLRMLEEVKYTNIFSFCYSPRPLTKSSLMEDDVPLEVKKQRLVEVQNLQKKIQLEKNRTYIGKLMKVLCSGRSKKDPRFFSGRNEGYQMVNAEGEHDLNGKFVDVVITSCGPHSLQGKTVKIEGES